MKERRPVVLAIAAAMVMACLGSGPAWADDDRGGRGDGLAFGIGAGIVKPDGDGEFYLTANLRIPLGGRDDGNRDRRRQEGGIKAYLEPEIGYWERSDDVLDTTDLYGGLNLVGVVPGRTVDYFFGVGFGVHSFDNTVDSSLGLDDFDDDDTRFGGNFHVGLDVHVTDHVALFGVGRLDLLEGGEFDDSQTKVFGGLRFQF